MPSQTIFDLDGRQAVESENDKLQDEVTTLKHKLQECEANNECLEKERDALAAKWKGMQQDIDGLTRYDLHEGDCDESKCNAAMAAHKRGDYLSYDEVERICEI